MTDSFGHNFIPPSPWTQFLDSLPEDFVIGESVEETTEMCDDLEINNAQL